MTFLRRNFYRQFDARTRYKPNENLWAIWFGGKNLFYGLFIAPSFRNGVWESDKSEIRRAPFVYWTIGHVLETGLVVPSNETPHRCSDIGELLKLYQYVFRQSSNSNYEKGILDRYLKYLRNSSDILSEPLLVPEFRYGGLAVKHEHRLDYTVFNCHVEELTGFELSPHSTHGAIKKQKGKTLKALNQELIVTWEDEMAKRNDYFQQYGIPIVTFTDGKLVDLDQCFGVISERLARRSPDSVSLAEELVMLDNLAA